jgi:hypothetical protein
MIQPTVDLDERTLIKNEVRTPGWMQ